MVYTQICEYKHPRWLDVRSNFRHWHILVSQTMTQNFIQYALFQNTIETFDGGEGFVIVIIHICNSLE